MNEHFDWKDARIFVGGKELTGVTSVKLPAREVEKMNFQTHYSGTIRISKEHHRFLMKHCRQAIRRICYGAKMRMHPAPDFLTKRWKRRKNNKK